jgi:hypothetical protein
MMRVAAYLPDGRPGPGRPVEVELEATVTGSAELVLAELTVRDERGGELLTGPDLVFEPSAGGGPLAADVADRQARGFGITNTAYHAQRAMRYAARLLGSPLPYLTIRIGAHADAARWGWGGGHYRLPSTSQDEPYTVDPAGEVHLGSGRAFLGGPREPYFHAPAHNAAIIYHEVGHHVCRHTADFRVNRQRPMHEQHNGKNALDEGTADFLAAVLLDSPDIYGWHRGHIPEWDPRRRRLDTRFTMAYLRPGSGGQAHANGCIWASALWSARGRVRADGCDGDQFTAVVLRALARLGRGDWPVPEEQQRRNQFSVLLRELLAAAPRLAPAVEAAMAGHGIHPQGTNPQLRERARGEATTRATG